MTLNDADMRFARGTGMLVARILELWEQHADYCQENGRTPGGMAWRAFLTSVTERENAAAKQQAVLDEAAQRAQERRSLAQRQQAERDAQYAREAVGFTEYLDSLLTKPEAQLNDAERWLLLAGSPRDHESIGAYLMAALSPAGKAALARQAVRDGEEVPGETKRVQRCGCGAAARTWVSEGIRYWGGKCERCVTKEQEARRRGEERA